MKLRSLSPLEVGLSVTLNTLLLANSTYANPSQPDYVCAQKNNVWTTWIRDSRGGMLPLIRWTNNQIDNWPPKKRCVEVSKRMQRLADNGLFNHMSDGTIQRQPVICGVRQIGENCTDRNVIVTLKPSDNPNQVINKLLDISARSRGNVVELSGGRQVNLQTYMNGQTYVNMKAFKQVLENTETPVSPSQLTPVE